MELVVKRHLIPVDERHQWVDILIWRHDCSAPTFFGNAVPPGFYPGLLYCQVDGRTVAYDEFDRALASVNMTRADIIS